MQNPREKTMEGNRVAMRPDPTFHASPKLAMEALPENFTYTLLLSLDFSQPDALAVIDVKPGSPTYSKIVHVTMPKKGDELHHFGWNACSSALSPLAGHAFIEPEEVFKKTGYSRPHTVHCGPEGTDHSPSSVGRIRASGWRRLTRRNRPNATMRRLAPICEQAINAKIADQRDFVLWWDEKVRRPGNPHEGELISASEQKLTMTAAEEQTGITNEQVSRWRTGLEDEEKYRERIRLAAQGRS
jgi:56kDa selenium binding protein (SBP56)